MHDPSSAKFRIGVEEEFFIVDASTLELVRDVPWELHDRVAREIGASSGYDVMELMACQVEVRTEPPCDSFVALREELRKNRKRLRSVTAEFGARILSTATHPISKWSGQRHSNKPRYDVFADRTRLPLRRLVSCSFQIHVEVIKLDERVRVCNACRVFLPYLLALSSSSPFWGGVYTGLKSYRLSVFDQLPRTGIPQLLRDFEQYEQIVDALCVGKLIDDESELWWDIRPRKAFDTVELRIPDACPSLDEALSVTALYVCLVKAILAGEFDALDLEGFSYTLLNESRWQAQLNGVEGVVLDFETREPTFFGDSMEKLVRCLHPYSERLGCHFELEHCLSIVARGTCADRQTAMCSQVAGVRELAVGGDYTPALIEVVEQLCSETEMDAD